MVKEKLVNGSMALAQKQPQVITIEATEQPQEMKLRVAAYARVSSASEDQLNSFEAQRRYYTDLISGKENWTFVDLYADEGIAGTSAKKRADFQRLMADCRRGRIDRILTKSISRFARNTKECLEAVRELKLLGVGVCFEEQNINTAKVSGEMLTTIFASIAQSESESISKNVQWGIQQRMQAGTFLPPSVPYGYRLIDRTIHIEPSEAGIVRKIFRDYLAGKSHAEIARGLNQQPETRPGATWQACMISYILSNERYMGDALWQKAYRTQTLPSEKVRNRGALPKYYVTDVHPPIVDRETYELVRKLTEQRKERYVHQSIASSDRTDWRICCGHCGSNFRRKTVRGTVYWVCYRHEQNRDDCPITQIPEREIKKSFLRLYYDLKHYGSQILTEFLNHLTAVRDRRVLWSEDVISLNKQISEISSQLQMLAEFKKNGLIDHDIYISQSNALTEQLRTAKRDKERILEADGDTTIQDTREILDTLENGPEFLDDFDAELFGELIDKIIVESNEKIRFRLKNGLELPETIERTQR